VISLDPPFDWRRDLSVFPSTRRIDPFVLIIIVLER